MTAITSRLALVDISVDFRRGAALDGVSLAVAPGEVVALMGDNGAGKSTLVNIVAGNRRPSRGTLLIDGVATVFSGPAEARGLGIETVHQDLALCDNLTAAANVFLGRELRIRKGPLRILDHAAMEERTGWLLAGLRSDACPDALVKTLSGGQRQAVALARARLTDPRIVLLDEPASALGIVQRGELLAQIRDLRARGAAILFVSHAVDDVMAIADRVAILHAGRKIADRPLAEWTAAELTEIVGGVAGPARSLFA